MKHQSLLPLKIYFDAELCRQAKLCPIPVDLCDLLDEQWVIIIALTSYTLPDWVPPYLAEYGLQLVAWQHKWYLSPI